MTQGDPEKLLLETIDSFVVNSNFYEPPCSVTVFGTPISSIPPDGSR